MSPIGITLIVVFVIVILPILWYIGVMNSLRQLEIKVEEAESGIDVALTKRFDVLTKIVNTVKGYAKHEAETFENVTKWRAGLPKKLSLQEKQEFMGKMDAVQSGINIAVEAYPELKAAYEAANQPEFKKFGIENERDKQQYGSESLIPKMGIGLAFALPYFEKTSPISGLTSSSYLGQPVQRYLKLAWGYTKDNVSEVAKKKKAN